MNHLPIIIQREYLNKVKNKSFIIMTFVTPLIMVGVGLLIAYLTNLNKNKERVIDVIDESGYASTIFSDNKSTTTYNILTDINYDAALKNVKEKEIYGLLYIKKSDSLKGIAKNVTFYTKDTPSITLISDIESKIAKKLTDLNYKNKGFDIDKIKDAKVRVNINQESYSGEKTSKIGGGLKLGFGLVAGYILFMFIIIYGNMIMRSVIEEKTNRIIEIIISSVKPIQLMLGKIMGTSLAGITQVAIWVIVMAVASVIMASVFGVNMAELETPQQEAFKEIMKNGDMQEKVSVWMAEIFNLPLTNLVIMFILFFIGGFLLYSSLYAAIGAAVDNETDTQQFMMPIILPLMLAVYVGGFTVLDEPHGTVAQIFSYIPFTSPVVMLMRIPFGVPIWQQLISVVMLFGTFIGTVWFASKIYRVGILMYGKKPSYKELYKWLKY
ncbi:ABC transporter permease [Pseudofulvibacter geojedonensis]|uniref:ABC transporter permease n=1 Tax=Pseudofulvibacter geojedonensis TaxID=1123758 RepID=A0ABW3HYN2_9FLAO